MLRTLKAKLLAIGGLLLASLVLALQFFKGKSEKQQLAIDQLKDKIDDVVSTNKQNEEIRKVTDEIKAEQDSFNGASTDDIDRVLIDKYTRGKKD